MIIWGLVLVVIGVCGAVGHEDMAVDLHRRRGLATGVTEFEATP